MRGQPSTADRAVARIAGRQHGVITFAQLLAAGLSRAAIDRRVRKGQLIRVHRGVYRVGHASPSVEADYLAAVLAAGPGAVLCGLASAHLLGLIRQRPGTPEVRVPRRCRIPGVVTSYVRNPHPLDASTYRGIPTLTVPATIVALAARLPLDDLADAAHEADVRHGMNPDAIERILRRRRSVPASSKLRAVVHGDHALLLSRLEKAFVALLRVHGLPLPVTNRRAGAHFVDCRWPGLRLTVELDSYRFHRTRKAWEADHDRRRAARARADEFRRFTWRDVVEDPAPMLGELRELLAHYPSLASAS